MDLQITKDAHSMLSNESKYVYELIKKYHNYFSRQDKKYGNYVKILKIITLSLAMSSTIVLGLRTVIDINLQVSIGLVLSSIITFITAIASYFNLEKYWMRNIAIHIELNLLRDNYIYDAEAGKLDDFRTEYYRNELDKIQKRNMIQTQKGHN